MNKFNTMIVLAVSILTGCVSSGIPTPHIAGENDAARNTEKIFLGVPPLLSLEGSVARLNSEWLITAAHNKPILEGTGREVFYHPTCDVALVREKGDNVVDVGKLYTNDNVSVAGYPIYMPLSISEGKYHTDVDLDAGSYPYPDCVYSLTDAASAQGMSGGGVYNENEELVGVYVGILSDLKFHDAGNEHLNDKTLSAFIYLGVVRDWIEDVTGTKLYKE